MPRGGGGAGRGAKKNYKGQRRHFTDVDELKKEAEKNEREKEWRRQRGIESEEEEEEEDDKKKAKAAKSAEAAKNRDMPPSDSSSEESESEEDEDEKPKGVAHLIDIQNPNRAGGKTSKKVTEMGQTGGTNLSRREREEIEKQEARRKYQALHAQGKTEEAQADLARLAIIRKQREEAAKKKDEEKKARDAAKDAAAKTKGKS